MTYRFHPPLLHHYTHCVGAWETLVLTDALPIDHADNIFADFTVAVRFTSAASDAVGMAAFSIVTDASFTIFMIFTFSITT
jgi:hypothetical protein